MAFHPYTFDLAFDCLAIYSYLESANHSSTCTVHDIAHHDASMEASVADDTLKGQRVRPHAVFFFSLLTCRDEAQGQLGGVSVEKHPLEAILEILKSDHQSAALKSTNEKEMTRLQVQDSDKVEEAQEEVKKELKLLQDAKKRGENLQEKAGFNMTDVDEVNARLSTTEQERDKAMNQLVEGNKEIQQKEGIIKQLQDHLKEKDKQMSIQVYMKLTRKAITS